MFKHLGLYEMILETIFKHWILVLGTPERCPALHWTLHSTSYSPLCRCWRWQHPVVNRRYSTRPWNMALPRCGDCGSTLWCMVVETLVFLCLGSPVFCTRQPALVKVSDWFFVVFYCFLAEVVQCRVTVPRSVSGWLPTGLGQGLEGKPKTIN